METRTTFWLDPHRINVEAWGDLAHEPSVDAEFLLDGGEHQDVELPLVAQHNALVIDLVHEL
jgi:hypothetical protein